VLLLKLKANCMKVILGQVNFLLLNQPRTILKKKINKLPDLYQARLFQTNEKVVSSNQTSLLYKICTM
jgi:hypothetical protein